MPYKKGPNNTDRYYDSSTGRYSKDPRFAFAEVKRKLTTAEKEQLHYEELFNRACNSKDPLLFDVYYALESKFHKCVKHINDEFYDEFICDKREIDIVTKKLFIEIKSGSARKKLTQFQSQQRVAAAFGKKHIVYAPDILKSTEAEYKSKGIIIVKTIDEVVKYESI